MPHVDAQEFGEWYAETFGSKKNQILSKTDKKRLVAIVQYLNDCPVYLPGTVEVVDSHVAIETVEAHGLEIGVDAVGNAVHVSSSRGFYTEDVA